MCVDILDFLGKLLNQKVPYILQNQWTLSGRHHKVEAALMEDKMLIELI